MHHESASDYCPATPDTMGASSLYHANSNIDDLTLALMNLSQVSSLESQQNICCCCGSTECQAMKSWLDSKEKLKKRLHLSAEVGSALLQRHEAYVRQHESNVHTPRRASDDQCRPGEGWSFLYKMDRIDTAILAANTSVIESKESFFGCAHIMPLLILKYSVHSSSRRHDELSKSPFQTFVDVLRDELRKNRELQENVKQLQGDVDKLQDSETMKRAREAYERATLMSSIKENSRLRAAAEELKKTGVKVGEAVTEALKTMEESEIMRAISRATTSLSSTIATTTEPNRQAAAYKTLAETLVDALNDPGSAKHAGFEDKEARRRHAYLSTDKESLVRWCSETTYNVLWATIEQYLRQGLVSDSKVLDIQSVDVSDRKTLDSSVPVFVVTFSTQEVLLFRNAASREIVIGAENRVAQCVYAAVITRVREELADKGTGRWKVVELTSLLLISKVMFIWLTLWNLAIRRCL
ncbi:hypothetical protein EV702DRAFT_1246573 [Suillus placidus]|uniref:Tim44-like domain-containing protein n=1 Tax=Suillus placidus TaxID=48579 RepID=A0A9P6ZMU3_9AGAM|nr:hypothetical protein EV702DRAFT_1246573 [Suillus placidus]